MDSLKPHATNIANDHHVVPFIRGLAVQFVPQTIQDPGTSYKRWINWVLWTADRSVDPK